MFTFMTLVIMLFALALFAVVLVGLLGSGILIVFGDLIVCVITIVLIVKLFKWLFKRKK